MDGKKDEGMGDLSQNSNDVGANVNKDGAEDGGGAVSGAAPNVVSETEGRKKMSPWVSETLEWVQAIVIAVVLGYLIKTFLFTLVSVSGESMLPTFNDGDRLFVYKLLYKPAHGDVIVFRPPNDPSRPYIKRVIAMEGQTIDINFRTHSVYVDGQLLDEPYIFEPTEAQGDLTYPHVVKPGTVFVMGDNRNNSHDSRKADVEDVDVKTILGKASFRWWPLNKMNRINK